MCMGDFCLVYFQLSCGDIIIIICPIGSIIDLYSQYCIGILYRVLIVGNVAQLIILLLSGK